MGFEANFTDVFPAHRLTVSPPAIPALISFRWYPFVSAESLVTDRNPSALVIQDNCLSMMPNENEDDEMNIDWRDVTFDDLDESSSTMPNENEKANDEDDDMDIN